MGERRGHDAATAVEVWRDHDLQHAIHVADREAIGTTEAARVLVLEHLARPSRDLWSACAQLGRLLADAGASPTLAAATIDGALRAYGPAAESLASSARAAVTEGYVGRVRDIERAAACRSWTYGACVVEIGERKIAVAAGYPDDDGIVDWAAEIASKAARNGVKAANVHGREAVRRELSAAFELVGIRVLDVPASEAPRARRWPKLPWQR